MVFILTMKMLWILSFNRRISSLADTLKVAAGDLLPLTVMFGVIFTSFSLTGFILFHNTKQYSTILRVMSTLFSMLLGSFDYHPLKDLIPMLGPLFFLVYTVTMMILVLNIFIAILNISIGISRWDMAKRFNDYELLEFAVERFKAWVVSHTPKMVRRFLELKLKPKYSRQSKRKLSQNDKQSKSKVFRDLNSKVDKMEILMARVYLEELLIFEDDLTGKLPESFER